MAVTTHPKYKASAQSKLTSSSKNIKIYKQFCNFAKNKIKKSKDIKYQNPTNLTLNKLEISLKIPMY